MRLSKTRSPNFQQNLPASRLKKVLSDLKEAKDIEGAVLIEGKGAIIACDLPDGTNYEAEIPKILALIEELGDYALSKRGKTMFAQCIFDYNGCKMLVKRLKNFTLLVMLQKRGYIGLAMLDIENSIRRIDEILGDNYSYALQLSDLAYEPH